MSFEDIKKHVGTTEWLVARLAEAFQTANGQSPSEPLDLQRSYSLACVVLAQFLYSSGQVDSGRRFMELSEALGDLRDGIASPLLAAVAKRGRPPDTSTIWRLRCKICCYIEYLSPTEIPSEQTITNLVKKHRKVLVSRREVDLASAISSWQKSFAMTRSGTPRLSRHTNTIWLGSNS